MNHTIELEEGITPESCAQLDLSELGGFTPEKEYGMWAWLEADAAFIGKMFGIMNDFVPDEYKDSIEMIYTPADLSLGDFYRTKATIGWKYSPLHRKELEIDAN